MNTRITRRQALAVGFGAVLVGRTSAAPVPKTEANTSWVGKTVLPKKYATRGSSPVPARAASPPDPDDPPVEVVRVLQGASHDVKAEKGTRVEVIEADGTTCWIEKAELVVLADAVEFCTKALKEDEKDRYALITRGWAYYLLGKPKEALKDFDEFLKPVAPLTAGPARWEGLVNRGLVLAEEGEHEKALKDLDEAVTDSPLPIAYIKRGYTRELMGEYRKALEDYETAIMLSSSHTLATNNKAWLLATCPDEKFRDGTAAVKLAKDVCARTKDREGMYLDTLAAAYAESGKFDDAVKVQEKVLVDKAYVVKYGEDGQKRLQLYKDKKPFRTEPVKK